MPAVASAIARLIEYGFEVEFITVEYANHIPKPIFPKGKVNEIILPVHNENGFFPRLFHILTLGLNKVIFQCYHTVKLLRQYGNHECLFGVDQRGMILAVMARMFLRTRVIYYSMELYLSNEMNGFEQRMYKKIERFCNKRTWLTLMQDTERAALLIEDNRISESQIMIVPNSPCGKAIRLRGTYFNDKFGVSEGQKIVLYAGNIINWAMTLELVESALSWPEEWVLVIHGYIQGNQKTYLDQIKNLAISPKIILSLEMVSDEEVGYLHESADIGIALYAPERHKRAMDFTNIAHASGKLIRYLKGGLPIVTSELPGLKILIDQYQCGICVSDTNEIKSAISCIISNYEEFSSKAVNAYNEEFEFTKHFDPVIERINECK
jgi:glycosyltransferase involved in cell wall biosynthesis